MKVLGGPYVARGLDVAQACSTGNILCQKWPKLFFKQLKSYFFAKYLIKIPTFQ